MGATDFRLGMAYPTGWDPYFREYMTLADIYRYPRRHFDHHRRQLTLPTRTALLPRGWGR